MQIVTPFFPTTNIKTLMKAKSREKYVFRAIVWSVKIWQFRQMLRQIAETEKMANHLRLKLHWTSGLDKRNIKRKIEVLKRRVEFNLEHVLYDDLEVPRDTNKKKIFGELSTKRYFDIINEKSKYYCPNYISESDIKHGYIELNELIRGDVDDRKVEMIINLHTGEYIRADEENLAQAKPVNVSAVVKMVLTIDNYKE